MTPVRTAARALLSAIFVVQGARTVRSPDPLLPAAKRVTDRVGPLLARTHPALPSEARTLVQLNGAVQVVAGLLMVNTALRRPAAALLAGSLAATTLAGHPYWQHEDASQRKAQQIQFLKNLGLLGGLILAATDTEGRPGLRWRTAHLADHADRAVRRTARQTRQKSRIAVRAAAAARRLPG
jgi:putative oxidoreductase